MEGGDDNFDLRRPQPEKRSGRVRAVPDPPENSGDTATAIDEADESAFRPAPLRRTSSRVTVPRPGPVEPPGVVTPPAGETLSWRGESVAAPPPVAPEPSEAAVAAAPDHQAPAQLVAVPDLENPERVQRIQPTISAADLRRSEIPAPRVRWPRRTLALGLLCLVVLAIVITSIATGAPHHASTVSRAVALSRQPAAATTPALSLDIANAVNSTAEGVQTATRSASDRLAAALREKAAAELKAAKVRKAARARKTAAAHKAATRKAAAQKAASSAGDAGASTSTPSTVLESSTSDSSSAATQAPAASSSTPAAPTTQKAGPTGFGTSTGCASQCK
jgi:hypothetical protein